MSLPCTPVISAQRHSTGVSSQLGTMATSLNNSRAQRALKASREGKDKPESSLEKGSCLRNGN